MRTLAMAAVLGFAFAIAACSEAEQRDTNQDVRDAAAKVGTEAREVVSSPELKEVGSEIKEAAGDVGQVVKGAAAGARDAAGEVKQESEQEMREGQADRR